MRQQIATMIKKILFGLMTIINTIAISQNEPFVTPYEISQNKFMKEHKIKSIIEYDRDTSYFDITTFDREGRTVSYERKGKSLTTYEYDHKGRRTRCYRKYTDDLKLYYAASYLDPEYAVVSYQSGKEVHYKLVNGESIQLKKILSNKDSIITTFLEGNKTKYTHYKKGKIEKVVESEEVNNLLTRRHYYLNNEHLEHYMTFYEKTIKPNRTYKQDEVFHDRDVKMFYKSWYNENGILKKYIQKKNGKLQRKIKVKFDKSGKKIFKKRISKEYNHIKLKQYYHYNQNDLLIKRSAYFYKNGKYSSSDEYFTTYEYYRD